MIASGGSEHRQHVLDAETAWIEARDAAIEAFGELSKWVDAAGLGSHLVETVGLLRAAGNMPLPRVSGSAFR